MSGAEASEQGGDFLNLVRVLRAEPQAGESIRILALEIYEDGFAVRWALPSGPGTGPPSAEEAGLNPLGLMALTLRDDLHTRYEHAGMFGGGTLSGKTSGGVSLYKPAIPAEATWLELEPPAPSPLMEKAVAPFPRLGGASSAATVDYPASLQKK